MKAVRQILAIAHTEFRFSLRRGAPVVVMVLIGLIMTAGLLITPVSNLENWSSGITGSPRPETAANLEAYGISPNDYLSVVRSGIGDLMVISSTLAWILIYLVLLFLPVAAAVTVPADRKFGASELLRSMPMTGTEYLLGKVLGVFASALMIGAVMLLLFFILTESILISRLHLGLPLEAFHFYIGLSIMDGLPMLLWGSAVGVVIGVLFRSRRAALLPGFLGGIASCIAWSAVFRAPKLDLPITDLIYYYLLQNYHSSLYELLKKLGPDVPSIFGITNRIGVEKVLLMYFELLIGLAIMTTLARLWLKWKENF